MFRVAFWKRGNARHREMGSSNFQELELFEVAAVPSPFVAMLDEDGAMRGQGKGPVDPGQRIVLHEYCTKPCPSYSVYFRYSTCKDSCIRPRACLTLSEVPYVQCVIRSACKYQVPVPGYQACRRCTRASAATLPHGYFLAQVKRRRTELALYCTVRTVYCIPSRAPDPAGSPCRRLTS